MFWVQSLAVVLLLALCHAAEEENLTPITDRQDESAFTLGYNGHDYVLVKSRLFYHQTQAEKYCLYHHRMRLARVPDEDTRRALQSSLFNIQRNQGYTLKTIAIAERTNQPIHTGDDVSYEDLNPAGATCMALGAQNIDPETGVNKWDGDKLLLLTRECMARRTILCEDYSYCDSTDNEDIEAAEKVEKTVETDQNSEAEDDFEADYAADEQPFTLNYNNIRYLLVQNRKMYHDSDASSYCRGHNMQLARVEDEATLQQLQNYLFSIERATGYELREIATGLRTDVALHTNPVSFNDINSAGENCAVFGAWDTETKSFTGEELTIMSKKCNGLRTVLCQEYNECVPPTDLKAIYAADEHKFTLNYNNIPYLLVQNRQMFHDIDAGRYCQLHNMQLARVEDEETLQHLQYALFAIERATGYQLREIATGLRTDVPVNHGHGAVSFNDINSAGENCAIFGAWNSETQDFTGDKLTILSKNCNHQRTVLCQEYRACVPPPDLRPIYESDEYKFTLNYNGVPYLLVKNREMFHDGLANRYCREHDMELARVEDEDTLKALQYSLFNIQRNQGYHLREIATGLRTNLEIHTNPVPFNDINSAGENCAILGAWDRATQSFTGDELTIMSKDCHHQRTVLCQSPHICLPEPCLNPIYEEDEREIHLNYNQRRYILVMNREMWHDEDASRYCKLHDMHLATVEDEDTLRHLQYSLFEIQRNTGYQLREIAVGLRTDLQKHTNPVPFEEINSAGAQCAVLGAWNSESKSFDGNKLTIMSKDCHHKRTLLCEESSHCSGTNEEAEQLEWL